MWIAQFGILATEFVVVSNGPLMFTDLQLLAAMESANRAVDLLNEATD